MDRFLRLPLLFLLAALAACAAVPPPATTRHADFGTATTLAVGDSVAFDDGLTVRLAEIADSRCPANVQCVWAGELAPLLVMQGGAIDTAREVRLGTARTTQAQVGAYTVTLGQVVVDTAAPDTATITVTRGGPVAGDSVRVDTPQPGQTVGSPLVVRGAARGAWFFEASFPVTLLDGHGARLAQAPAQADGNWMTTDFVPFSATLSFPPPATATGTLVLENANPSGDPAHAQSRRIDVTFANASGAGTGVRGYAHVGPTCPVERWPADPACADRPYAGTFAITSVGGTMLADVTTGADGRFARALAPGSYSIHLTGNDAALPSMAPQPFVVRSDGWTNLDLALDSGIR
jgi:hypothetical protein